MPVRSVPTLARRGGKEKIGAVFRGVGRRHVVLGCMMQGVRLTEAFATDSTVRTVRAWQH